MGLIDRAQLLDINRICEMAAQAAGAPVVPFGDGRCLTATMTWTTLNTGARNEECARVVGGVGCRSNAIHDKSLHLTLTRASTTRPVAETTATISSDYGGFSPESFHALCTAAFHDYPQPLKHEQFEVPVQ